MKLEETLYKKFPVLLREKLLNDEIAFPDTTRIDYEPLWTYRAVERQKDDRRGISREDFRSYFELNKKPKMPRGLRGGDITKDPYYYGVSSFLNKEIVEQKMKFPNPNKKMAAGYVYKEGGPQDTKDSHVCWWLFEDADVSGFRLMEDSQNEG
ncbi:MAG: hypothetical protein HFG62_11665 [Lachnospiraceae bacterium]|nr:hypothetical protein [Lachnospiraceae bacterium]